jgi:NAD(P)-dependent dehydrogenase (short-subunit alcohol dehydrogenase family)
MQRVLITGSNRGLGLEWVRQCAKRGWQVFATCRDPDSAVVDAGSRFVARGGSWQPTPALEREILRAALDETPCKRL